MGDRTPHFDPVAPLRLEVSEHEQPVAQVDDPVGLDRDFLPRLFPVRSENPWRVLASMQWVQVRKDAREMDLDLRREVVAECVEVTPVDSFVDPAHDLDIPMRHARASISQVDRRRSRTVRRLLTAFALGAALGTGLDAIHVYGDVEAYRNEVFGRLGWFVPIEFGLAGVASALAMPLLERVAGGRAPRDWPLWERVREVPLLIGLYVTSVGANGPNAKLFAAGLLVLVAARLAFTSVHGDWVFALVAGIAGPAVEAAIHATGAFHYTEPDFLGIPVWLPALWANGGLAIRRIFGPLAVAGSVVPEADEPAQRAHVG